MVTCGRKQIYAALECPSDNNTETMISIHLLLSSARMTNPNLTLSQLKEELCRNRRLTIAAKPLPQYADRPLDQLTQDQKVKTVSPVPVALNVDGVDMRFNATVVLEGNFHQGLYLGRKELRCYNIGEQPAFGEATIDERASLVVAFGHRHQEPIPLFGMIDTGSGVSILSFKSYQKLATASNIVLKPFETPLFAANNKIIHTLGLAEDIPFQLGGHTLQATFVVLASDCGVDDFLLGRNFLRKYNVLVDLTARKMIIRNPNAPQLFKPQHQVSDDFSMVVLNQDLELGPGERSTV